VRRYGDGMKLDFETYLLVSLVSLAHVVALAAILPARSGSGAAREATTTFLDEEGITWMGPSIGLDANALAAAAEMLAEVTEAIDDRDGYEEAAPAEGAETSAMPGDEAPARLREVASSELADIPATQSDESEERPDAAASGRALREIRPLSPASVN
jgi:hypothetical protein